MSLCCLLRRCVLGGLTVATSSQSAEAAVVSFAPSNVTVEPGETTSLHLLVVESEFDPFVAIGFVVGLDAQADFDFDHNPELCRWRSDCPSFIGPWLSAGIYETDLAIDGLGPFDGWEIPFYLGSLNITAPTQPGTYQILISPEIEISRTGQVYSTIFGGGFFEFAPVHGSATLTVVPEPALSALLACGLLAAYAKGRRRRGRPERAADFSRRGRTGTR